MSTSEPPLSFGVLLAFLGAATVVGVGVALVLQILLLIPVVMAVVLVVGLVYLFVVGTPEPPAVTTEAVAPEEEPFEDPVEEADRLESSGTPPEPPAVEPVSTARPAAPASDGNDSK